LIDRFLKNYFSVGAAGGDATLADQSVDIKQRAPQQAIVFRY
jgi:hypothetical protein